MAGQKRTCHGNLGFLVALLHVATSKTMLGGRPCPRSPVLGGLPALWRRSCARNSPAPTRDCSAWSCLSSHPSLAAFSERRWCSGWAGLRKGNVLLGTASRFVLYERAAACRALLPCPAEPPAPELWLLLGEARGVIPPWASQDIGAAKVPTSSLPRTGLSAPSFLPGAHRKAGLSQLPGLGPGVTCVPPRKVSHRPWFHHEKGSLPQRDHSAAVPRPWWHLRGHEMGFHQPFGQPQCAARVLLPAVWHGWPKGAVGLLSAQTFQPTHCRLLPWISQKKSSWKFPITTTNAHFCFLLQKHNRKETAKGAFN